MSTCTVNIPNKMLWTQSYPGHVGDLPRGQGMNLISFLRRDPGKSASLPAWAPHALGRVLSCSKAATVVRSTVFSFMVASAPVHLQPHRGFANCAWSTDRTWLVHMDSSKARPLLTLCLLILFMQSCRAADCLTGLSTWVTLSSHSKGPSTTVFFDCHASTNWLCYCFILIVRVQVLLLLYWLLSSAILRRWIIMPRTSTSHYVNNSENAQYRQDGFDLHLKHHWQRQ